MTTAEMKALPIGAKVRRINAKSRGIYVKTGNGYGEFMGHKRRVLCKRCADIERGKESGGEK